MQFQPTMTQLGTRIVSKNSQNVDDPPHIAETDIVKHLRVFSCMRVADLSRKSSNKSALSQIALIATSTKATLLPAVLVDGDSQVTSQITILSPRHYL